MVSNNCGQPQVTYFMLTGETKPTQGVHNGDILQEMNRTSNTVTCYMFDATNGDWVQFGTLLST